MEEVNLLCTADLHLGRYPSRIPDSYGLSQFSPTSIWDKIIQQAINSRVDGVVITGDIVDRENSYYEAYGPFEAGVKRLNEADIPVFAVAGNHDCELLPQLARSIDIESFNLLGAGGKWEVETLKKNGKPLLNLIGWSYPTRHIEKNPLTDLNPPQNGVATVGLLHAELGSPNSSYIGLAKGDLEGTGITGWVLGHIHKPQQHLSTNSFILNPGSPQPLTPNDQDCHSVWQLKIKAKGEFEILRCPLANLRYLNLELDVSDLKELKALPSLIIKELEAKLETEKLNWLPELISLRVQLIGRSRLYRKIALEKESLLDDLELQINSTKVVVERLENNTKPTIDLNKLAAGDSSVALLADYLLKLDAGEEDKLPKELFTLAEEKLKEAYCSNAYTPLRKQGVKPLKREEIVAKLKEQGQLLLDTLLAQKEGENG